MRFLINFLLEKGDAKKTGIYIEGQFPIPLFKKNKDDSADILSTTKKTGRRLLRGERITRVDAIKPLMDWIICNFPQLKKQAEKHYETELDSEKHQSQIISGAANHLHSLTYPPEQNKPDFFEASSQKEKVIFIVGGSMLSIAFIVFYYTYANAIHLTLAGSLVIFAFFSAVSLFILNNHSKAIARRNPNVKYQLSPMRIKSRITTILLCLSLAAYQLFLMMMVAPNERHEAPYTMVIVTLLTFLIVMLCGFLSFYQLTHALTKLHKKKNSHYYFLLLSRYKMDKKETRYIVFFLFFASASLIALANLPSLWEAYKTFGQR